MTKILSQFALLVCLFLVVATADAQQQTWSDSTGKFTVKADFVGLKDGNVQLKRADGQVITVPLDRLSAASQKLAQELAKAAAAPPAGGGPVDVKNLKLAGSMEWSEFPSFENGKEQPRDLHLVVEARGKAAADAIAIGFFKIDSLKTSDGEALKRKEDSFQDLGDNFEMVDRENSVFDKQPKDGVRATFELQPAGQPVRGVAEAKGSFKIRTGGQRETIKIEKVTSLIGKQVELPQFEELKVKATVQKDNETIALHFDGDHSAIYKVEIKSPTGRDLKGQNGGGSGGGGNLKQFMFFFDGPVPANATFFVHVAKNTEEVEIPFSFSNLRVPKQPKGFGQ